MTAVERIIGVAIKTLGTLGIVYDMPAPSRHHHLIARMARHGIELGERHEQGFTTSAGRFVDRHEAVSIAETAGQLIRKTMPADELFSEDLW